MTFRSIAATRLILVAALSITLTACFGDEIWTANLRALPQSGTGRMIFALDASQGPLEIALVRGTDDPCAPEAWAQSPRGKTGVDYFAFDVRPGEYSLVGSWNELQKGDPDVFSVPEGKAVYIGRFVRDDRVDHSLGVQFGLHLVRDDLAAAQQAVGPHGVDLELADTVLKDHPPSLCERVP